MTKPERSPKSECQKFVPRIGLTRPCAFRASFFGFLSGFVILVSSFFRVRPRLRKKLLLLPSAAESLNELHAGDLALAGELRIGAFGSKRFAAGIDDFEI